MVVTCFILMAHSVEYNDFEQNGWQQWAAQPFQHIFSSKLMRNIKFIQHIQLYTVHHRQFTDDLTIKVNEPINRWTKILMFWHALLTGFGEHEQTKKRRCQFMQLDRLINNVFKIRVCQLSWSLLFTFTSLSLLWFDFYSDHTHGVTSSLSFFLLGGGGRRGFIKGYGLLTVELFLRLCICI